MPPNQLLNAILRTLFLPFAAAVHSLCFVFTRPSKHNDRRGQKRDTQRKKSGVDVLFNRKFNSRVNKLAKETNERKINKSNTSIYTINEYRAQSDERSTKQKKTTMRRRIQKCSILNIAPYSIPIINN